MKSNLDSLFKIESEFLKLHDYIEYLERELNKEKSNNKDIKQRCELYRMNLLESQRINKLLIEQLGNKSTLDYISGMINIKA